MTGEVGVCWGKCPPDTSAVLAGVIKQSEGRCRSCLYELLLKLHHSDGGGGEHKPKALTSDES